MLVSGQWGAAADDQHQQPGKVKVQAFQSYPCFALCVRQMINIKLHITTILHHTDKSENIRQQQFWISFLCLVLCAREENKINFKILLSQTITVTCLSPPIMYSYV